MSSNSKLIAETQLGGHSDQTGALDIPAGTTAQRPSSPSAGYIRMNTTLNKMEMYNGSAWVGVGGSELRLYAVTPTTAAVANTSLSITGEGFVNGATVHFVSAATGTSTSAASVSFVSATKLTVTTPTLAVAGEPWSIKVTNPDGTIAAMESILDAGGTPTWSTAAGQIGATTVQNAAFSSSVAASDPDGTTIVYSESGTDVLTGSGSGKLGFTLNSGTGAIAGTMPALSSDTTFNFTLGASDGTNLTTRNFNIGGIAAHPVNYIFRGSGEGGSGTSDTTVWNQQRTSYGWHHNSNGSSNANTTRIMSDLNGSAGTGYGITQAIRTTPKVTIPSTHNKMQIKTPSMTGTGYLILSSTTFSAGSYAYASGATYPGTGWTGAVGFSGSDTVLTLPTIARGDWYLGLVCYGGQNANVYFEITLLRTYYEA